MALAINVIDRRGPGNKIHCQLQPKKTKVQCKAVLAVYIRSSKRHFTHPSLLTRQSALVLKVGVSYGWKMTKCIASYSLRRLRQGSIIRL